MRIILLLYFAIHGHITFCMFYSKFKIISSHGATHILYYNNMTLYDMKYLGEPNAVILFVGFQNFI